MQNIKLVYNLHKLDCEIKCEKSFYSVGEKKKIIFYKAKMAENNSFLQAEECDFNKILVWIWKNNKTQNIFETIIYNFPRKVKISTVNMKVNMLMGSFFGAPDLFFVSIEHK